MSSPEVLDPSALTDSLAGLTPEQRALLMLRMRRKAAEREPGGPELRPVPRDRELPLSFAQQRLWFMDQWQPRNPAWNIASATRFLGRLDIPALGWAFDEIVRRHESLRTGFTVIEGRPVQVVRPPEPLPAPVVDLAGLPAEARSAEVQRLVEEEELRPFDLSLDRLVRAALLRCGPEEHVALVTMHHIVSDGWSIAVFVQDFAALYEARLLGRRALLPELPVQVPDFAVWQREWLEGERLEAQLAYWRQALDGAPPVVELPVTRPWPAVRGAGGADESFALSGDLATELRSLSRREGATLFMTLLAALDVLLHRYSGATDLLVGSPVAGRNRAELEGLIGLFVNTLVLRADLSGDPSVRTLLARTREATVGAQAHQDLPFEKLIEELRIERDPLRPPLVQVVLSFQNTPPVALGLPGVELSGFDTQARTARYDLMLSVTEVGEGIEGYFEYSTDLFDAPAAARIAGHFQALFAGMVADPECRLSALPMMTGEEIRQVEALAAPLPSFKQSTLHRRFEAVADWDPQSIAVLFEQRWTTYGELDALSNRLARRLRRLGVGPEVRVGLCLERSLEIPLGMLGILKAGGAYVPLDPDLPAERLAFLVEDSGIRVVVTREDLAGRLPGTDRMTLVSLDDLTSLESPERLDGGAEADNAAYVIYTSGSTGRPKGVVVRHAEVARLLSACQPWFGFTPLDVWTLFHSFSFDFSVWEIWGALAFGGRLVVVPFWVSRSPEAFARLLRQERVTVLNQTPSAFRQLVQWERDHGVLPVGPSLLWMIFGGEALELPMLAPWLERHGDEHTRLANMYGITETTVHVTFRRIVQADLADAPGSMIGEPIPDLRIALLDSQGRPVPDLVPGEICVAGRGLARGYLGRPELTAERFGPDPFEPGARLYRSGDLARRLPGGDLQYLGRRDDQLKIRGFRIEPGEIEAALVAHPAVAEAAVLARERAGGEGRMLVAYVRWESEAQVENLRAFLRTRLPDHMIPAAFVAVEALPLTSNGKLDRRALARLEVKPEAVAAGAFEPPATLVEETLAEVWEEVLGVERVGARDSFFALGGDSILSLRVLALARERGVEMTLQQLFHQPVLRELAREVGPGLAQGIYPGLPNDALRAQTPDLGARRAELGSPGCEPGAGIVDAYPLARLQAGMLFHTEYSPATAVYHDVFSARLRAPFDAARLRRTVENAIARHPVLRTSFDLSSFDEPLQLVHGEIETPFAVEDLRGLPERNEAVAAWLEEERHRGFVWSRPPLVRFQVHRLDEDVFQLTLSFHHSVLDGWSAASLLAELFRGYLAAEPLDEEPPPAAFREFVLLERMALESPATRGFWRERLAGAEPSRLPRWPVAQRDDPAGRARDVVVAVPAETLDGLRAVARAAGVPLKSALLAVHVKVLSRWTGRREVLTGLVANGRPESEGSDRALGLFLNTLPLRLRLGAESWAGLVRAAFETEREMLPHRRFPLAELQAESEGGPLFETVFNFVHFHVYQAVQEAPGIELLDWYGYEETDFPLGPSFQLDPSGARLDLRLSYQDAEIDAGQAEALAGTYARALAAVASMPDVPHEEASLLSAAELSQLVDDWGQGKPVPDTHVPVHRLFERQAEAAPDRIALVYGDACLSYGELNARANRAALWLRDQGAGPEIPVGIALGPSLERIVLFLAALKAGSAYVPLDLNDPRERVERMMEQAGVGLVVTSVFPPLSREVGVRMGEGGQGGEGLAYVMFTSGSTGEPKAVAIPHRGIARLALGRYAPDDTILQISPITFDASTAEIWGMLLNGGRVVLGPGGALSLGELGRLLERHAVTVLWPSTGLFHQIAAHGIGILRGLSEILPGGDVLASEAVNRMLAELPGCALINGYGPTENTTHTASFLIREPVPPGSSVPIGRPIPGASVHVLDETLQLTPPGVPGELFTGGDGLARGYLGRPDLTAERFVPDPSGGASGARLYRTGDRVFWGLDGNLRYLGRVDRQVKIRGFRIEPSEVETALSGCPDLRESIVGVREDLPGGRGLAAYVVPRGSGEGVAARVRDWLAARLPEYMQPAAVRILPEMPLTANGKPDREALARLDLEPEQAPGWSAAPRDPVEEMLAAVWTEVLGVERPAIDDDFFELGGHSLLAIQAVSRVRSVFGVEIPLRWLFEEPTIAGLAARIGGLLRAEPARQAPPIVPRGADAPADLPLSFAQERLWFLEQLQPGTSTYNMPAVVRLRGTLDAAVLGQSLDAVVARHESLRTRFPMVEGHPVQAIGPIGRIGRIGLINLEALPAAVREAEAWRLAQAEAERPFDLVDGPLLRAALLRLSEADHLALLTMHHVVSDGWSMGILIRELATLYRHAPLPELPIQYADFALWQRGWLHGEVLEEHLGFWRERLAGAPAVLDLPLDRPHPAVQSFAGDARPLLLDAGLTAALHAFGRRAGSTLFMTLLAAFDALLHRLTGASDVVVGVPSANRNRAEIEGLIGFFVNSLVLRVPVSADFGGLELIGRVREAALSAFAHQDLPFEKLVAELRPERALSHTPLFQVLFQVMELPASAAPELQLPGLTLEVPEVESRTAKLDMVLSFQAGEDALYGEWRYSTALFDGATIQRLAGQLQVLLRGLVADPGRSLADLPLLTEGERHQALIEWNDQDTALPDVCFPELFAWQAGRTPGAVAVACDGRTLTYAELSGSVRRAARRLIARGVGPETVVGVLGERSPEYLIVLLAVLEAGGVYLPLDPAQPPRRREQILAQSGAQWVIDPAAPDRPGFTPWATQFRPPGSKNLSSREPGGRHSVAQGVNPGRGPDNLAYVIFTSGSTGVPKGAMLTHRGLLNHLRARISSLGLTEADAVAQTAPQIFDISIWQSLGALLVGGRVQIVRTEVVRDPLRLLEEAERERITVLEMVPSLLGALLQGLEGEPAPRLESLRWLIATGEALPPGLARGWHSLYPDIPLIDAYGPTECTDRVSQHVMRTPPGSSAAVTPIGRPLSNVCLHVLDAALRPQPVGAAGELCIGGAGVGRGYLGDPARTAEAFVPDPFAVGARLYRTGDLARRLPDGVLEFLGRRDHQVKIRGFRIEVGEVAAALDEHPAVRQCVVLARPQGDGALALVAYVVVGPHPLSPSPISLPPPAGRGGTHAEPLSELATEATTTSPLSRGREGGRWERGLGGEVLTFLRHRLPDYALPAAFVELEALPLTPNGKLDRRALPDPFVGIEAGTKERIAPRTPLEELIAELWREALGLVPFGVHDNFFALGGDSIKGAVLIHRLRRRLGEMLHVAALFDAPTVADLAAWLEARHPAARGRLEPIRKSAGAGPAPLSFSQERIWFLQQLEIDGAAYNMPTAFRLRGELDAAALDRALCEIARRHETLRTRFPVRDGQPLQVVEAPPASLLTTVDLAALPSNLREDEASRILGEEALRPFDLEQGPLVRALSVGLGKNDSAALFVTHHITCDGWSMGLWAHEIAALYRGEALPEPPVQYADFARWQRGWLEGEALESQVGYWRERLRGLPPVLDLPADRPRPPVQTFHGASELRLLPADLVDRLRGIGQRQGASLFMVLLAAFQILLSRWSGQDDLAVGSPIAGRTQPEVEGLIGCFLNTLVLRADLSGRPDFPELVRRVRETALGAYAHQDVPFEKLLEELRPERDLSRPSLFQVLFNMLNAPASRLDLPGLDIEPYEPGGVLAKFDLTLYLAERGDGLILNLVYNTDLFDRRRMEELLRQYAGLAAQIAERPEASIGAYSLLTAEARAVLPDPQTPLDPLWVGAVHDLFAEQARRHPERLALTELEGTWTYGELDLAVDRLASVLHAQGIGKGDRVAVYAHRSSGLVQALLGILRTGAAFGILDPVYPPSRIVDILRLARPRAVLHVEAAGPLPVEVEEHVAGAGIFLARPGLTPGATQFRPPGSEILSSQEPGGRHSVAQGVNPGRGPAAFLAPTGPHDIAAVAFTSGSTGVPKGILQTHGSMSHFIPWHQDVLGYSESDRFTMLSGLAHDPLQRDIFYSLSIGATLCIPDPDRIGEPGYLADWMRRERITVTHLTPAMAQLLTEGVGESLPDLRCAVLAGDILTRRDVARVRRLAPQAVCVNVYGATESQRALSYHLVEEGSLEGEGEARERQILPLGRGKRGVQLLVLSREAGLAGIGEIGEIAIRSPHLAHGYLDDPEQTARRFVANPFTGDPEDRVYLTGDLGRYLPDGEVAAAGRADQQIKIRGYRVEPGEIEAELGRLPGVRESVVVGRDAPTGEKRVVAFVVLDPAQPPSLDDLRERLRERLPAYMVPAVFVPLDRLPLNPNGKVDRRALPNPEAVLPAARKVPPRDGLELRLARIWEEVLETAPVGVTDNFFDLGGHSLLAVRLMARIAHKLGRALPLAVLFQAPTVEDLARLLRREGTEGAESPLVPIQNEGSRPPLFLIHPAGGQVLCYFDLARALGPDQPVWGLQDVAPAGTPRSLAGLAAEYLRHVRTVQPAGPYHFAGWSFGGRVAFEMARQLQAAGEEVAFLGMIDTGLVEPSGRPGATDAEILIEALGDFPADRDELRRAADPVANLVEQAKRRGDLPPDWSPENARHLLALFKAHLEVARTDRPSPYPGRLTFFAAEEQPDGIATDPSHGWSALAEEIDVVPVPGNHVSAIEDPENVRILAERLRAAIPTPSVYAAP